MILKKKECKMKNEKKFSIGVVFEGSFQTYHYLTRDESIEPNDLVVVISPHGPKVCKVVEVNTPLPHSKAKEWVVQRVDLKGYNDQMEKEVRKATILKQLEAKQKAQDESSRFKVLAETDTEASALLAELREL
jgi:hypothetical protein